MFSLYLIICTLVGLICGYQFGRHLDKKESKKLNQNTALNLLFQKEVDPTKKIWLDWQNEFKSMRKRYDSLIANNRKYADGDWRLMLTIKNELQCYRCGSYFDFKSPWDLCEKDQIEVAKLYPELKEEVKKYYEKTPTKEDLLDSMLAQYEKAAEIYIQQ